MRALLIGVGVFVLGYAVVIGAPVPVGRRTATKEFATLLPNLLMLFKGLVGDPRVPRGSKALLLFGAA